MNKSKEKALEYAKKFEDFALSVGTDGLTILREKQLIIGYAELAYDAGYAQGVADANKVTSESTPSPGDWI